MLRALVLLSALALLSIDAASVLSPAAVAQRIARAKARTAERQGSKTPVVQYWHNWADDKGETHFTLCNLTQGWQSVAFGPGQPPIYINALNLANSTALTFFYTPALWNPQTFLHPNPVVQFGFWMTGEELFESSDGTQV